MRRTLLTLVLVVTAITAAALFLTGELKGTTHSSESYQPPSPPSSMILQEDDGERLVHRAGPLKGVPFTIKVDGLFGNSEDFFVFSETLGPRQTIPFHMHHNAEELLIFQEAGVEVMVGDKRGMTGSQSIVFIPRDTWISATNTTKNNLHTLAIFSRHGFEDYMRAISAKPGQPLVPLSQEELTRLRTASHAMYWDTSKGKYPPGVNHP